jgi:ATP-binding cassette subfamily F protein 3
MLAACGYTHRVAWLEFSALAFGYSDERVIAEAQGALNPGDMVGLVGQNGGGKTTLLRLLLGELAPEAGRVQRARQLRPAYVSQGGVEDTSLSLWDFVRAGRDDLMALEEGMLQAREELARAPVDAPLLHRLGELETRYAALGGHAWDNETERLLLGLSFTRADLLQPLFTLSGGQQQKASLARALLGGGTAFIFDEPTNHLDLDAQAFFADYVRALIGRPAWGEGELRPGMILVSHDRWLLDALCTHIWELDVGTLYRYVGNYSRYAPLRELRRRQQREAFVRQQEHIARTEEYIRRNIAGQNTRQARGRRTLLMRMERLERPRKDPAMRFILAPAVRTGEQVLLVERLAFNYGSDNPAQEGQTCQQTPDDQRPPTHAVAGPSGLALNPPLPEVAHGARGDSSAALIGGLSFALYRGERLGIAGPNGCGKTTLLKLLAKLLAPSAGMVAWGSNTELGVFSQDSSDLAPESSVLAELRSVDPVVSDSDARDYLARFGFSGDDVVRIVSALSGGERSRLSLAKIFRQRPNVLLLDEPTNHLDIYAREALEQFLEAYDGAVVMVTHDRALLDRLCSRVVVFERLEEGGFTARFFRGAYSAYLAWRTAERARAELQETAAASGDPAGKDKTRGEAQRRGETGTHPIDLTLEELQERAEAAHMSAAAYARKQHDRTRLRAQDLEQRVGALETQLKESVAQQRRLDQQGRFTAVAELQMDIERLREQEGLAIDALADSMVLVDAWEALLRQAGG